GPGRAQRCGQQDSCQCRHASRFGWLAGWKVSTPQYLSYALRFGAGNMPAPFAYRAIAFGFSDLTVAVIPAEAGIQGRVTGLGALDSRLRGNDRGAKCDRPGS